ncbi:DUF3347 domain-containing protein [Pontibacter silvestris]|uniref:DUF3347 domain-containing protein n=1 Tax=Pontibacter silvestris TaxID=2305183 RepID=A0ABW4X0H0_9BACT|nr:DUF3347 domain-containing protein [Pontibacter silvestris]MCC9136064.1 DUF3347 domain-containing protein [Pontibacter silvestris]
MTTNPFKRSVLTTATIAIFLFASCSENSQQDTTASVETEQQEEEMTSNVVVETPDFTSVAEPINTHISQLVDEYLKVKDALVSADAKAAQEAANLVLSAAQSMPVATLVGDHKAYAEEKVEEVKQSASKIANANDIAAQRENLELLSEATFSLAKAYGANERTLYYQHCPMAQNNEGGYWMSASKEIENPYFGDAMRECGSTEEVLN